MAVYTSITESELEDFLTRYDVGNLLSFKGIAEGVENSNFLVVASKGKYILTLYEKRVSSQDLPFFLGLMEHLSARGIPCPVPVHACDGSLLFNLKNRAAAMVTFLEGSWPRHIKNEHCREVGAYLARMHNASVGFSFGRANGMAFAAWQEMFEIVAVRADSFKKGLRQELVENLTFLHENWPEGLPEGVIHADLFPDNVFFKQNKLSGVLDFYFACNDFFAYDIAICLNAWCFEPTYEFNITKASQMLGAYVRERDISAEERAALPVLCSGAALRFLLSRLQDWLNQRKDAMVTPKDPAEYLKKLRFHREVRGVEEYGL